MEKCSNCGNDISHIEVITRKAKSGPNIGNEYKARICETCNTFNFINDDKISLPTDNKEIFEMLKRIETKVDQIYLNTMYDEKGCIKNQPKDKPLTTEEVNWEQ